MNACVQSLVMSLALAVSHPTSLAQDVTREQIQAASQANLLILPIRIGDQPERPFIFDTGASSTLIVNRRQSGEGSRRTLGGAGSAKCEAARLPATTLRVLRQRFTTDDAVAMDLSALQEFLQRPLPGVIGGDLLREHVWLLDYARGTARIVKPPKPNTLVPVPIRPVGKLCCSVEAVLTVGSKRIAGRFLIDTGAPGIGVVLTRAAAVRHGLLNDGQLQFALPGLCASAEVSSYGNATLAVADVPPQTIPLLLSRDTDGALAGGDYIGVVGGEVLGKFGRAIIDGPRSIIWVAPPPTN